MIPNVKFQLAKPEYDIWLMKQFLLYNPAIIYKLWDENLNKCGEIYLKYQNERNIKKEGY